MKNVNKMAAGVFLFLMLLLNAAPGFAILENENFTMELIVYDPNSRDNQITPNTRNIEIRLKITNHSTDFSGSGLHFDVISLLGVLMERINGGQPIIATGRPDFLDVNVPAGGTIITDPTPWVVGDHRPIPGLYTVKAFNVYLWQNGQYAITQIHGTVDVVNGKTLTAVEATPIPEELP